MTPHFFFFTFLTSLTHHLSMVKFSEKKSVLENFRANVLKFFPLPLRLPFLIVDLFHTHISCVYVGRDVKIQTKIRNQSDCRIYYHALLEKKDFFFIPTSWKGTENSKGWAGFKLGDQSSVLAQKSISQVPQKPKTWGGC